MVKKTTHFMATEKRETGSEDGGCHFLPEKTVHLGEKFLKTLFLKGNLRE